MIGLKYWDDPNTYYTQENNPQEQLLYKEDGKGFLEFCGATAAVSILHAIGADINIKCPGIWKPQPEAILGNFFHDPRNYKDFLRMRPDLDPKKYFNNRIYSYYPLAIQKVFNIKCRKEHGRLENIEKILKSNTGILVQLQSPGHFIAVVAYSKKDNVVIYNEPWKKTPWPSLLKGSSGFNRYINMQELEKNMHNQRVLIGV